MSTQGTKIQSLPVNQSYSIDAKDSNFSPSALYVGGTSRIGLFVKADTGTYADGIVGIQVSPDGVNFYNHSVSITGEGYIELDTVADYIIPKLASLNTLAATITIEIRAK